MIKVKLIHSKKLGETLFYEKLSNGLEVFILPKKDFYKSVATLTAKFGSIDTYFSPLEKKIPIQVPDGIAHFLEHKMFESKQGDVLHSFAKEGATINAITNFTRTSYTLSTTTNIYKNISTLLDFVQDAYFTDLMIKKEKRIIEQEIKMYDNNPDWRARFKILENMYNNHPAKNDIAGTIDSINQITKEDLYACYDTFYHPNNMLLFVIGPVVPDELIKHIKNNQENKIFRGTGEFYRIPTDEDAIVNKRSDLMKFSVPIPKFFIGHKEPNPKRQGQDLLKYELSQYVLFELMFGESSMTYEKLYDYGYINMPFNYDCTNEEGFGFSIISGDSQDPEAIIQMVNETIDNYKMESIKQEDAQRAINKVIGFFLKSINSPLFIANQFTRHYFNEMNLFRVLPTLENLSENDLVEVLHLHFSHESQTTLIVNKP
ncbi:insulinase family protein [Ornithinibacillus massiliensis]|uniref:Insulinase family protein n=1 Tax=Ornithinibacillus massiliensis TaxID=1944633 RepID=A0ABS5M9F2_9BACI|nr:pitrilysin family protein [Ornithinibacillus massiliensis]MBS3678757.1 insulinase family protein [Ornithinibacillus massiliensis]